MQKEVSRSKCRLRFVTKYYSFAMVFIDDISSTMLSVCSRAVCSEGRFGPIINNSKGCTLAFPVLLLKQVLEDTHTFKVCSSGAS